MIREDIELHVLGSRGSVPAVGKEYELYGGNTSCFFLRIKQTGVVLDLGTGALQLQPLLAKAGIAKVAVLMSHMHLDHVLGFPFAGAFFNPENHVTLYGEGREGLSLQQQFGAFLQAPFFPIGLEQFTAKLDFITLKDQTKFWLGEDILVSTCASNHPNQCTLFRLDVGDKRIVYALDYEHEPEADARLIAFAKGASLLIYDGYFTQKDFLAGWGHSTWQQGASIAAAAGVKQLLVSHHAKRGDASLQQLEAALQGVFARGILAKEGEVIRI